MSPQSNPESATPFRDRSIPEIVNILQVNLGKEVLAYALGDDDTRQVEGLACEAITPEEETEATLRDLAEITEIIVVDKEGGSQTLRSLMLGMNPYFDDNAPIGAIRDQGHVASDRAAKTAHNWGEMGA